MSRGGARPGSGRKPAEADVKRIPRQVGLTVAEFRSSHDALEPHEEWPDFVREALVVLPRYRVAVAEIEDMIRGCRHTLSTAHGDLRMMYDRQLRTLEFVLGLLKPPRKR